MTRTIQLLLSALFMSIAIGGSIPSIAAPSYFFNAAPVVVLNPASNTTEQTNWALPPTQVLVGAGLTNSSFYVYGVTHSNNNITQIISRTVNATRASSESDSNFDPDLIDTTLSCVQVADAVVTGSWAYTGTPFFKAVAGYLVIVFTDTTDSQLYAYSWAGGSANSSASGKVAITAFSPPAASGVNTYSYAYTTNNAWIEDGIIYVAFTVITVTSPGSTSQETAAYIQGFSALNGTLLYTNPQAVVISLSNTAGTTFLQCGPSNYTNSTYINCLYKAGTALKYVSITRSNGTAGFATTVTTDGSSAQVTTTNRPLGILSSSYASGGLFYTKNTSSSITQDYYLQEWNTTKNASRVVNTGLDAGGVGGAFDNTFSWTFETGYLIAVGLVTSASPYVETYSLGEYLSNGTMIGSQIQVASIEGGYGNFFVDVNGSLWFTYISYEVSSSATIPAKGNILTVAAGKLLHQVYSVFGNIVSIFFTFITLSIGTLFVL